MLRFDMILLQRKNIASLLSVLWGDMIIFGACMGAGDLFSETVRVPSWRDFRGEVVASCKQPSLDLTTSLSRPVLSGARHASRGSNSK